MQCANALDGGDDAFGMPVCRVDDNDVYAGVAQFPDTSFQIGANAHRSADAQTSALVAG